MKLNYKLLTAATMALLIQVAPVQAAALKQELILDPVCTKGCEDGKDQCLKAHNYIDPKRECATAYDACLSKCKIVPLRQISPLLVTN